MNSAVPSSPKPVKDSNGLVNASLAWGVSSLGAWLIPGVGVVVALIGVVLSCLGLGSNSTRLGRALIGLMLSLCGLSLAIIVSILYGPILLQMGSASIKMMHTTPSAAEQAAGEALNRSLVKGAKFPDFSFTDLDGVKRTLSDYQGKVVLVDFWATWCRPCNADLPGVQAAYDQNHDAGFDILGVGLEMQDKETFATGLRERGMVWPQAYDGNWWNSALAVKFGVRYVPQDYLLDRHGVIISKNPSAKDLAAMVAATLRAP